jgi:hypothetical protein
MNKKILTILICTAFLLFLAPVSLAHSPYIVKVKNVKDPTGNPLVIEILYDDGLIGPDPGRFQIRNKHGVIIAKAPHMSHIWHFCPSLKHCWVFPYEGEGIEPLRLDYTKLNYTATSKDPLPPDFQSYLESPAGSRTGSNEYYTGSRGQTLNFKPASSILKWISPFIIILDNLFFILFTFCVYTILAGLFTYCLCSIRSQSDKTDKKSTIIAFLSFCVPLSVVLFFSWISMLAFGIPLYLFVFALLGLSIGNILGKQAHKKFVDNQPTKQHS